MQTNVLLFFINLCNEYCHKESVWSLLSSTPEAVLYSSGDLWTVVHRPLPEQEVCVYAQHSESWVLGCRGTSFFLEYRRNNSVLIYKKCTIQLALHFSRVSHIFSHLKKWKHSYSGNIISEKNSAEYWDSSSSSIGTTAHCGLWPVEQCPSIFSYLPPTLHLLTPSTWRSLSTSSFHPFLGLPLLLVPSKNIEVGK